MEEFWPQKGILNPFLYRPQGVNTAVLKNRGQIDGNKGRPLGVILKTALGVLAVGLL
jgi:hypothetical protein